MKLLHYIVTRALKRLLFYKVCLFSIFSIVFLYPVHRVFLSCLSCIVFLYPVHPAFLSCLSCIETVGLTGNALAVADYLNQNAPASTLDLLNDLNGNVLSDALDSVSPSRNSIGALINNETSFALSSAIGAHIDSTMWSQKANRRKSCDLTLRPYKPRFTSWFSTAGHFTHIGSYQQNPSFNYTSELFLLGCDYVVSQEDLFGMAFGYVNSHFKDAHQVGHGDIDSGFMALYAHVAGNHIFFKPALWSVFNSNSNVRSISFPGFSANASTYIRSWQLTPHLEVGYIKEYAWGEIIPFSTSDWVVNWQQGYTESGADPFNALQKSARSSILRNETGIKVLESFCFQNGTFYIKEKASYVISKPFKNHMTAALEPLPDSLTLITTGHTQSLFAFGIELFAALGWDNPLGICFDYDSEWGKGHIANMIMLTVSKQY